MSQRATVVDQTLRSDLSRSFLPQPPNHSGDVRTKMYQVTITQEQGHLLLEVIEHAARQRLFTPGTQSRGLAAFVEACEELIRWRAK